MPQRAINLLAAIAGVLIVVGLVLIGADVYRSARTGSKWKRRLVAAGLFIMTGLGFAPAPAEAVPTGEAPAPAVKTDRSALDKDARWQRLSQTWASAEEVAAGRRGPYPFNERGKKQMLADLAKAGGAVDALRHDGLLTAAEAGLLKKNLTVLTHGVQAKRPTEMRVATCYKPMMPRPAKESLTRLNDRLALLEKLSASKALSPSVLAKAVKTIQQDIDTLGDEVLLRRLSADEKAQAKPTRAAADACLEKIRRRLRGTAASLDKTTQWQAVVEAWRVVKPLAETGRSTMAQRAEADKRLSAARAALAHLAVAGWLQWTEADLLAAEADALRTAMYRNPPTDTKETCYDMAVLPPVRQSLTRLTRRLVLLERLAGSGKVRSAVVDKVLPAVKADITVLEDDKQAAKLRPDQKFEAQNTRRRAEDAVKKIERLLEAGK